MSEYILRIERVEEGYVRIAILSEDKMSGAGLLLWSCDVNQDTTRGAQKAAMRATMNYLLDSIDLSEGGRC